MEYFNDKSSRQEPGYFFSNSFASFFIEPAEKLLDRFILGINIESVLSEFSGKPGMSEGFHAKMSRFSWMNSMSALSYFGSKFALMMNCLYESPSTKSTILVSSADLNFNSVACSVVGFFNDVMSAGST